jgi:ATP-binding cassette subfamily B protein/subfamily B ATP-binding cassette protein MsbA
MLLILQALDRTLALAAALIIPALGWTIHRFAGPMTERTSRQFELQGQVVALAEQTLTALPVVKAFTRESYEDTRFAESWSRADAGYLGAISSQLQFKLATGLITALGVTVVLGLGGWHVAQGQLSVGGLVIFMSYLFSLYAPLETLAYLSVGWASAAAGARRVLAVLESPEIIPEHPRPHGLPPTPSPGVPSVAFENVTFGYTAERPVLRGISLAIRPGEVVALVGANGAGKSTLVSLIPRFYDPWQGTVRVQGQDVRELKLAALRERIAFVHQHPFLLPVTVAENIGFGRPGATATEIEQAARAARAHDFIMRLPNGYETELSEGGTSLSGGERQRLALARAFLRDAPVVILDEPTSALDAETEHLILETQQELLQGRTTLLIAHRLSTLRAADRVAVLDGGRLVEFGSHQELLTKGGRYAQLLRACREREGG